MRTDVIIKVGGMSCVRCSAAVENALKAVRGVEAVEVSYANGRAEISFDDSFTDVKTLEKAIKKAGYTVLQDLNQSRRREFRNAVVNFCISAFFSLPFFVMMALMFFAPESSLMHFIHNGIFQLLMATPVQFIAGYRFYKGAFNSLKNKSPSMDLLVALGTTASYAYSVYSLVSGKGVYYFESAAMIITLVLLGKMLESRARAKTSEAIEKLMDLAPKFAIVLRDGVETEIPALKIQKGDIVVVRAGQSLPADGVIIDGICHIDESMLTGESMPIKKSSGDKVFGGTLNGKTSFTFKAENIGSDTMLSGIIRLVENAQSSKARIQNTADKVSAIFVPAVTVISLATFFITLFVTQSVSDSLDSAVAVLVIACPCSLGLATPTALMVGIGKGASNGILIKNADALEHSCKIKAIILDKTGTVTEGKPAVTEKLLLNDSFPDALRYAASAESYSEHPLASVIINEYKGELPKCENFVAVTGCGVSASVEGKSVRVGKPSWIESVCNADLPKSVYDIAEKGNTLSVVAINNIPAMAIGISDPVRGDSARSVEKLKSMGIHTVLVTGDNESAAEKAASEVGIDEVVSNVLPEGKVEVLSNLRSRYSAVAMVGDGINDAPALAASDVGFAVGSGTDIAMETGDIVLVGGGISAVSCAISLSRATMRKIKQNLFWAFFYNCIGIPLAAFGMLSPVMAGAAMAFSSVSVVTNSLLLKKVKI